LFGYCRKILRVNLPNKTTSVMSLDEKDARLFIGGSRGRRKVALLTCATLVALALAYALLLP
jgi:aldehyde:ferredoxin oxidoreductase